MSDPDEIVGHKTFRNEGSVFPAFRHEPLTRREADALIASANAAEQKRAADMPTEQDAVNALWSAQQRLKELGWSEPDSYKVSALKAEGVEAMLIEFSSSGIHRGHYHAVNGRHVWWIGPDGCPSSPVLVRAVADRRSAT